ncbi:diacylglycerol kinase family protein [Glycomyces scopariae]|uniref:Lipid kinase, YegS/Rv2252/BmrU family n=1 Tax=Glycomyces sambucus TaxID=380244 RepID=A0A1G9HWW4_9ACTN|nr:diacylglycerol kinase family protein [Glycomyces sambucus]SDL17458.1 lipid kinase, YegS/Rv2252/BmrU family [Glycomyces sambucus]
MAGDRIAIVWNPAKTAREDLRKALPATDAVLSWHETTPEDPGRGAADEAIKSGAEAIVAVGGDGTVRAVAERLAQSDTRAELGVVPLGTGNLLARNLGIPLNNLAKAFERAFGDRARPLDLGWIEAEIEGEQVRSAFAVLAGFGLDAHMITQTDEDLKSRVGWLAYVESLGRAVNATEVVDIELVADGGEPERTAGHTLLVGNCGTLQGGIRLLPDADPADGELDLLLLSAEGIGQWVDTLRSYMWDNGVRRLITGQDRAASADTAQHGRAKRLEVRLSQPLVLEIDGDDLGEAAAFTVEVQERALHVR